MKKVLIIIGILLLLAAGAAGWLWMKANTEAPATLETWLYIPENSSPEAVGDSLRSSLGEDFGALVAQLWTAQKGTPRAAHGAYKVNGGDKALDVSRRILRGHQTPMRVSFNNVRCIEALAARIAAKLEFDSAAFVAACDSILPAMGFTREEFAAAFIPDSYEFYWTASPAKVVNTLSGYRDRFWTDERRQAAAAIGLTPVQVATLASIVEEESAKADERPKIARLYLNRLDRGMKLQADPTVKFAVGDPTLRRILQRHLATPSPYNTYIIPGLPPGPIRIPERATLEAVLSAPQHNYIYMCAKEDFSGYHNFSTDLATHQANARRYQKALNDRGIK